MPENDTQTLYAGKHLSLRDRGGWEFVSRNTARPAVGIVAVTEENRVVLVEQMRRPVGEKVIELPAGLSGDIAGSEDEALLLAAQRELLEETGYVATQWRELLSGYSSPGLTDESITFFLAQGLSRQGEGGGDESEDIQVHEAPLAQLLPWLRERGATCDMKLLAGIMAASEFLGGC